MGTFSKPVVEYDMSVHKKIPDHLMRDLKLSERRMWRSVGMFVVRLSNIIETTIQISAGGAHGHDEWNN